MIRVILLFASLFLCQWSYGQSTCLPSGITLSTQADVDLFISQYPDCTEILGALNIDNSNIVNLDSLETIESVGGDLNIQNTNLVDFGGLENLESVGGNFVIQSNQELLNFDGLQSLIMVSADFKIRDNSKLQNISGLTIFEEVGFEFEIFANDGLSLLSGLEGLLQVKHLSIVSNANLMSITALTNLTHLESLTLTFNNQLTSLAGLENLTAISGGFFPRLSIRNSSILNDISALASCDLSLLQLLSISGNPQLSVCAYTSICEYISSGGNESISNNANGCDGSLKVQSECCTLNSTYCPPNATSCFPGGLALTSQTELDAIKILYPNCTEIIGNVFLESNISNLDSLENIEIISGNLDIRNTNLLDFEGLENLELVGGFVDIRDHQELLSFDGLESLKEISGYFEIDNNAKLQDISALSALEEVGDLNVTFNDVLPSLAGLENLMQINKLNLNENPKLNDITALSMLTQLESLSVTFNSQLTSLDGLENVTSISGGSSQSLNIWGNNMLSDISAITNYDFSQIQSLLIFNNPQLSICAYNSICTYLSSGGFSDVFNNATGCQDSATILSECNSGKYYFVASNGYWDVPTNWSGGLVPDANSEVVILAGNNCMIKANDTADCKNIHVVPSSTFDCPMSAVFTVHGQ